MEEMSKVEDVAPDEAVTLDEPAKEAAPEETTESEPEKEGEKGDGEADEKGARKDAPPEGFVPHQAMHAERVKRQELEKQLADLTKWREQQEAAAAQAQAPQYVDPLVDPAGHRKWTEYQIEQTRQQVEAQQKQMADERNAQARIAEVQRSEAEFAATTPDYQDASQFLANYRQQELVNMGMAQNEILAQMQQDANAIFDSARNLGMSPAQLVYMRAQSLGYAKKAPEPTPDPVAEGQKLEAVAAAQKATQGLGSQGGQAAGKITASQLATMSEAELSKVDPEAIREALGG